MSQPPIFIVGSPRSGTTLVRLLLDSHPHIASGPETQFLNDMESIVGNDWSRIQRFGFEKAYWHDKIRRFFASFQEDYMQQCGKKRWAEKTPNYALKLDFINSLFPACQVVHVIRSGYDVVASHLDRWGYKRALKCALKTWKRNIEAARQFGRKVPDNRYTEVYYEQLVAHPETALKDLFDFLEEPWDPVVLRYNEFDHDRPQYSRDFMERRRKTGDDPSPIYSSRVGTGKKELDFFLRSALKYRAGHLLEQLGYA